MRKLVLAAVLTLAGAGGAHAATTAQPSEVASLKDYVRGRYAYAADDVGSASLYFAGALAANPNDPVLLRRTFDLALAAGDQPLASRLGKRLMATDRYDTTVTLLRITEALQKKDWTAASAARADLADAGYASFVAPVIEAWVLQARGKTDAALAVLDPAKQTGFAKAYVGEHRAYVLAAEGRHKDAADAFAALLAGGGGASSAVRVSAAASFDAARRPDEAKAALAGGTDPLLLRAAERLAAGRKLNESIDDPRAGVAQLFIRMSGDLAREKPLPIALVLARLATFLTPDSADAWFATTDMLARSGQYQAALAALDAVEPGDPRASLMQARRAAILQETDRAPESLALLQAAAADGGMPELIRLGEAYQQAERFPEAAAAFERAFAASKDDGPERWYLHFARGTAYERAGDWAKAEPDLRRAAELAPQEAMVLNYLGYSLLDRGQSLPEAQTLVEKAAALRPGDGQITDSVGWAHYRNGQYAKAVEMLELAVAAVPGDPTINDHLGDAYWRVGRRIEARYRWRAALDAGPDDKAKARIAAKLDVGPDAVAVR